MLGSLGLLAPFTAVAASRYRLKSRVLQRIALCARSAGMTPRRRKAAVHKGDGPAATGINVMQQQRDLGGAARGANSVLIEPPPEAHPATGSPLRDAAGMMPIMPAALAAVTHAALCHPGSKVQPPPRALRRELGSGTLAAFRADALDARALITAGASGLACTDALDTQVRAFLARSWDSFAAAMTPASGSEHLHRAASLLGRLLAATPEAEARKRFGSVLAEWSAVPAPSHQEASSRQPTKVLSCDELRAMLEDHTVALAFAEELSPRARRTRGKQMLKVLRMMKAQELKARALAEAVTAVVEAMPFFLDESVEVFRLSLTRLGAVDSALEGAWSSLADAPPLLRLVFLEELASKGGIDAWEGCGVDAVAVATTCADMELAACEGSMYKSPPLSAKSALDGQTLVRVKQLLEHLNCMCSTRLDLAGLASAKALVLARSFSDSLSTEVRRAFTPLIRDIQQMPSTYDEADIISVAQALSGIAESRCWTALARALLARWGSYESRQLLHVMLGMPALLAPAPRALCRALALVCENDATALVCLTPTCLMELIDAWASLDGELPASLQQLLTCAVKLHILDLDVRRLIAVSTIVCGHQQDSIEADIMLIWQEWMKTAVDSCLFVGWGSCYEALREVQQWRDSSGNGIDGGVVSTAEMVFQGVVAEQLCEAADEVPLELLIELGHSVPCDGAVAARVEPILTRRVEQCLRGSTGSLSLLAAVAVADGETLVRCTSGSQLWDALTILIADHLRSPNAIDLFCRCRPSPLLRSAILELLDGWNALELQMRLA